MLINKGRVRRSPWDIHFRRCRPSSYVGSFLVRCGRACVRVCVGGMFLMREIKGRGEILNQRTPWSGSMVMARRRILLF